tara:strand:+ start:153 stop:3023 length:2871 start_codon:yes stop_codon:yes gene_type:complete
MINKFFIIFFTFLSVCTSQEHFILEIDETGESTLFLFEDSITTLGVGDEIGIFANNLLVGSGIWNGEDLPIIAIHGVDLSDFGGPVLPGASQNDSVEILIWSYYSNLEYIGSPSFSFGEGAFNGLFTAITSFACSSTLDECGVCLGMGSVFECGCYDIPNEECDCIGNILDCNDICGGEALIDECNVCNGDNLSCSDCFGVPNGDALLDECGVCNGNNLSCLDCLGSPNGSAILDECGVCNGDNLSCLDCLGIPNGLAVIDNCGFCDGDSTSCDNPEVVLSFHDMGGEILTNISYENVSGEVCFGDAILADIFGNSFQTATGNCISNLPNYGTIPIYLKNIDYIGEFQIYINGLDVLDASGGIAEESGFSVVVSSYIFGFSFTGAVIAPSGEFEGCLDENACNYNPYATINDNSCEYPDQFYDCNGDCLEEDCLGQCGGGAILDDCGVCQGLGAIYECGCYDIPDYECDCNENILDCEGICGGTAVVDCFDICGGNAELDDCDLCDGPGPTYECEDEILVCSESECLDDGGGDGDGTGGDGCPDQSEIQDCYGNCGPASWLGDGYCDEDTIDFNCLVLAYDMGDCEIDFNNHVMPIINANCTGYCHSGLSNYDGGLNLETYSSLMLGGNSGLAIQPYYPDYSLIIQKLLGEASGEQMPYGSEPLSSELFNTIYYWIEQGAIGSDNDDSEDQCPDNGEIQDCTDECVDEALLGDGNCDDGEEGEANFNCSQYIFDNTDCPVGILEFGNYTYNQNDNTGSIEVLMNCEFPVSNFEIGISGIEISNITGGDSEELDFNLSYTSSSFSGNYQNDFIPPNSGLLATILFDFIPFNSTQICFDSSLITTSAGYEYEAVLGECISIDMLGGNFSIPENFEIKNIFPNPFNPITTILYSIPNPQLVVVNIYNLKGEKIETLLNEFQAGGNYKITWDATNYASGVYFIQIRGRDMLKTKKITLSK